MSSVNNFAHKINLSKASSEYSHSVFDSRFKIFDFQPRQSNALVEQLTILSIFTKLNTKA